MDFKVLNFLLNYSSIEMKDCYIASHGDDWVESSSKSNYDIWLITKGEIQLTLYDCVFTLKKGDAFLLYPEMVYSAQTVNCEVEFIYTHFDFVVGDNPRGLDDFPIAGYIPDNAIKSEYKLLTNSFNNFKLNLPISSFELKGHFIVLLSKIFLYRFNNRKSGIAPPIAKNNVSRIHDALSHIAFNIDKHISVGELASISGMSEKYFITYFKKTLGVTPAKYITKEKMKKALVLLHEQKYSIKEISQKLGYADQYTFSKTFTKTFSMPPSRISL
jgi:AraC-like DNA-binding protein